MARSIAQNGSGSWPNASKKVRSFGHGLTQLGAGRLQLAVGLVDAGVIAAAIHFAVLSRYGDPLQQSSRVQPFEVYTGATTFTILACVVSMFLFELYSSREVQRLSTTAARLVIALISTAALMSIVSYWLPPWRIFRGMQLYFSAYALVGLLLWRWVSTRLITCWLPNTRIVMVGTGSHLARLSDVIRSHPLCRLEVGGSLIQETLPPGQSDASGLNLLEFARTNQSAAIVAAFAENPTEGMLQELLRCKSAGLRVIDGPSLYKRVTGRIPIRLVNTGWLAFGPDFDLSGNIPSRIAQRLMDLTLSILGLLLAAPLMLAAAILIKLTSPGPVLFRQERVGEDERPYELVKFRTMQVDAEKSGPQWAAENDSRLTPIGGFLRATRIDELPQLWTVLKGDMSFIGPRPEREFFVNQLRAKIPYYGLRFAVKPGLTGWAQVNYGYGSTQEDAATKLEYDLYYIQEMSPYLNLLILLRTVSTVIFRRGT